MMALPLVLGAHYRTAGNCVTAPHLLQTSNSTFSIEVVEWQISSLRECPLNSKAIRRFRHRHARQQTLEDP
jgi:hypothetical protein